MARNIANVEILTDTFNAWMLRTNEVINVIRTEVLTANSTLGVTGSPGALVNTRLWGAFTANNLNTDALALGTNFTANSSAVLFGPVRVIAGGSNGNTGQVLTSTGTGVQWATAPGTGTVTTITSGNGVSFSLSATSNTITTTGTINVRANTGIVVNTGGVSVNTAYLDSVVNPQTLQGYTWASPASIGTGTANTGKFTTVTSSAGPSGGYLIDGDTVFKLTNSEFRTQGIIDATTPNSGTTGGVRVRGNPTSGVAYIQITNDLGTEWGNFKAHSNGHIVWSGSLKAANGSSGEFPPNTRLLFQQETAPVGWTRVETLNDRALRLVDGLSWGIGSGGTRSFSTVFSDRTTANTSITVAQMPAHYHMVTPQSADDQNNGGITTVTTELGTTTTKSGYTVAGELTTDAQDIIIPYPTAIRGGLSGQSEGDLPLGHSHGMLIDVQYVDVIIATKDA